MWDKSKKASSAVRSCFITLSTLYNLHCVTDCWLAAADVPQCAELALASCSRTAANYINSLYSGACRVRWINTAFDSHLHRNESDRKRRTHTWPSLQISEACWHPACTAATSNLSVEMHLLKKHVDVVFTCFQLLFYSLCTSENLCY